ncbi:hypothetical protein [Bacteroides nordii]|uniref:hypothetical protein n=1 Tax=Bacteroides nordii TaxID=291645 RepID=UPI00189B3BD0|nr:hypothetical protein [Bacteroides nordii]
MTKGGQTGCLETTPCLFGDYALPAWRLRLAYMETTPRLHATFMVNFSSPGNNSLHPSVFYPLR